MTDLDNILTLIESNKVENCELAMLLLAGNEFPAGHALLNNFSPLVAFYNSCQYHWGGLIDEDYYRLLLNAAIQQAPALRGLGLSYALAELLGSCFKRPEFVTLDEWADLYEETISIFDHPERAAFLLNMQQQYSLMRANEYFFEMGKQEWLDCEFRPLHDWCDHFSSWQAKRKSSPEQHTELLFNKLLTPIRAIIETYIFEEDCRPYLNILEHCLQSIWHCASFYQLRDIQDPIAVLLKSPQFDSQSRHQVLLEHQIFKIWQKPARTIIGGMSGDCEANIYDLYDIEIIALAKNLNHYHYLFDLKEISTSAYKQYKGMVHTLWRYYYIPELMPFLQVILTKESNCPITHYHLAQYYQINGNAAAAIDYYMRYISLTPKNIPDNNWFLSEMDYKTICYEPSALYAIVQIGQIYESQLQNTEKAEHYYQKSIQLAPHHHQAGYWQLILLLYKSTHLTEELWKLLKYYYQIIYEDTNWINSGIMGYNIAVDVGENRQKLMALDLHKAMDEVDFERYFGFADLKVVFMYLALQFAEHFFLEEDFAQSLEAVLLAKKLFQNKQTQQLAYRKYDKKRDYPISCNPIRMEDILYYQAICVEELTKDYWQARSLLEQALKENKNYKPAKVALVR